MTGQVIVAVPMSQVTCRAWMDQTRPWSIVEEALLLALALRKGGETIASLVAVSDLPHQVVVASLSRLMRFRLVEISLDGQSAAFVASAVGKSVALEGRPLPHLPKEKSQRFTFGIEHVTGSCFNAFDTRVVSRSTLDADRNHGADIRILDPVTPDESGFGGGDAGLYDLIESDDRHLLRVSTKETNVLSDRYMRLQVSGSQIRHFPRRGSPDLRARVLEAARSGAGKRAPMVKTSHEPPRADRPVAIQCEFNPADVVVGGLAHEELLASVIGGAKSRLVIHSTFLSAGQFRKKIALFHEAVIRGVTIDLMWGAAEPGESHDRNLAEATAIAATIQEDATLRSRVRMRMRTTGSHAKLLLADREDDSWIAVVSSCNWLSSGFQRIELSIVLRHSMAVADMIDLLRSLMARRPLGDTVADELRTQANDLRRHARDGLPLEGKSFVTLLTGPAHDETIRSASGVAVRRLVMGSDRLGSTAWTGAIIPGELVKERPGTAVTLLYRRPSGPIKNRHARDLEREAAGLGIRLVRTDRLQLHGKFALWDDDDLVVTSLNWASASSDDHRPASEIGVHVTSPGIAAKVMQDLQEVLPEIFLAEPGTHADPALDGL